MNILLTTCIVTLFLSGCDMGTKHSKKNVETVETQKKHRDHDKSDSHEDHDHSKHDDGDSHEGHDHSKHDEGDSHEGHDHSKHDEGDSHEGHDHSKHDEVDSHEGHDHGAAKAIGENKAITHVDDKKGFKLSKEAATTIKLSLQNINDKTFLAKKSALVISKEKKGIYRFREGYFKFVEAKILKELSDDYRVKIDSVEFGDQIVNNGVALLRVADIYSTDTSEYGHSH